MANEPAPLPPIKILDNVEISLHRDHLKLQAYHALLESRNALIRDAVAYGLPDRETKTLAFLLNCTPSDIPGRIDLHTREISRRIDEAKALLALVEQARALMDAQGLADPNWPDKKLWEELRLQDEFAPAYTRTEGTENMEEQESRAEWARQTNGPAANMFLRNSHAMAEHTKRLSQLSEDIVNTLFPSPDPNADEHKR
jgi:hypothetical protein